MFEFNSRAALWQFGGFTISKTLFSPNFVAAITSLENLVYLRFWLLKRPVAGKFCLRVFFFFTEVDTTVASQLDIRRFCFLPDFLIIC